MSMGRNQGFAMPSWLLFIIMVAFLVSLTPRQLARSLPADPATVAGWHGLCCLAHLQDAGREGQEEGRDGQEEGQEEQEGQQEGRLKSGNLNACMLDSKSLSIVQIRPRLGFDCNNAPVLQFSA